MRSDLLAGLQRFDTPTICNCIELFEVRPRDTGYMDARIKSCFPELPPMVGFAATAALRCSGPKPRGEGYASTVTQVERFAELSGPPVVVFQDLDSPPAAATFGEIMCLTYQALGAVGLITSGPGRDLEQVRALRFPVFTDGAICSHGYVTIMHVHEPVHVGGITIYPDDLIHGDCNGVSTIPREIADELLDVADPFVQAEKVILDAMHSPHPTVAMLKAARAESQAQIAALRSRVSRHMTT